MSVTRIKMSEWLESLGQASSSVDGLGVEGGLVVKAEVGTASDISSGLTLKLDKITGTNDNIVLVQDSGDSVSDSGKSFELSVTNNDNKVPTSGAVVDYVAANGGVIPGGVEDNITTISALEKAQDSGKAFESSVTDNDNKVPTSGAVVDYVATNGGVIPGGVENNITTISSSEKAQDSGKAFETSVTDNDNKIPTSGAVVDYLSLNYAPLSNPVFQINATVLSNSASATFNIDSSGGSTSTLNFKHSGVQRGSLAYDLNNRLSLKYGTEEVLGVNTQKDTFVNGGSTGEIDEYGGYLILKSGDGSAGSGWGGNVVIEAGTGGYDNGEITVGPTDAKTVTIGSGTNDVILNGDVTIKRGSTNALTIDSSNDTTVTGEAVTVEATDANDLALKGGAKATDFGLAGKVVIDGGQATGDDAYGGAVEIAGGSGSATGYGGGVAIDAGAGGAQNGIIGIGETNADQISIGGTSTPVYINGELYTEPNEDIPLDVPAVPTSGTNAGIEIDTGIDDDDNGTAKRRYQRTWVIKYGTASVNSGVIATSLAGFSNTYRLISMRGDVYTLGPRKVGIQGCFFRAPSGTIVDFYAGNIYENAFYWSWYGWVGYTPDVGRITLQYWKSA